jgi:hypothetical protein
MRRDLGIKYADDPKEYKRRYFQAITADPETRAARNVRNSELRRGKLYPNQIKAQLARAERRKAAAERQIAELRSLLNGV